LCNNDVLYICIASNKFDLKQTIRVLHTRVKVNCKHNRTSLLRIGIIYSEIVLRT